MRLLANDGIDASASAILQQKNWKIYSDKIPAKELNAYLIQEAIQVLVVRSATQVTKEVVQNTTALRYVVRAGVGLDNVDIQACEALGIVVKNTPNAASLSVAELVMAHLYAGARFLQASNYALRMGQDFSMLKKEYSKGTELKGKTLGIIGLGRIGKTLAQLAIGNGMEVIGYDTHCTNPTIQWQIAKQTITYTIPTLTLQELLAQSDAISLHIPSIGGYVLDDNEFQLMKKGVAIINTARGGIVNEEAIIPYLQSGAIGYVGLDVFSQEPTISSSLLQNNKVVLSPHIGASTVEAQQRVGVELLELLDSI